MIERIDIALLEKYLAGELDQLMDQEGNPLTQKQADLAIDEYRDTIAHLEGAAFKADLQKRYGVENERPRFSKRIYWLAAAATLILALTFTFIWQQNNAQPAFEDYFDHFTQLETNRGDASSAYATALEAYSRRNYKEAFSLFNQLEAPTKEAQFFFGFSALATENSQAAIDALLGAGLERSNRYYEQTRWYLALAYWQAGDTEKAKTYLASIPIDEYNYDLAQQLLELL